ncbi:MAG TPA: hypothetical protein VJT15_19530 [Pyrinomonadaceae bacterium]|nr:hypothetical protein [Pyrinomonadaceae bacterium]
MKRICLTLSKYVIGIVFVSGLVCFSVQAQEPAAEPVADAAKDNTAKKDPFDTYEFPTNRERFDRYVKDTVGPFRLVRTAASAGIDQWRDTPEEWEQGMKGYGKRFASSLGRNAVQQTITYGLDEALDQDSSFHRSNRERFFPRVKHAFLETITSRTKSGKRVLSAPRLAGVYGSAVIATETWYPERYSYKDGLRIGTGTLLTGFGVNLVREFIINW